LGWRLSGYLRDDAPSGEELAQLDSLITPLVSWPWLALVPCACFVALYRVSRHKLAAVAATMWSLYAIYECAVKRGWLCSGDCSIRLDLVLLFPAMAAVSLSAAFAAVAAILRRRLAQS